VPVKGEYEKYLNHWPKKFAVFVKGEYQVYFEDYWSNFPTYAALQTAPSHNLSNNVYF